MKIINGQPLNEAFRYSRQWIAEDDIQEALDSFSILEAQHEELIYDHQIEKDNGEELEEDIYDFALLVRPLAEGEPDEEVKEEILRRVNQVILTYEANK